MNSRADIDTIVEALVAQRIGNMAASVRAAQSEVEPYGYESGELYDYRRPDHVLTANGLHRVPAPCRTLEAAPAPRRPMWQRRWVWMVTGLAVAIVILGVVIDLIAASLHVSSSTVIIFAAGAFVLLCALRPPRARGGSFSGTFTGRMHR